MFMRGVIVGGVLDVLPEGTTSDTDLFFRLLWSLWECVGGCGWGMWHMGVEEGVC